MSSLFSAFTSSSSRQQQSPNPTANSTSTSATSPPPSATQRTTEARAAFDAHLAATGASLDSELQTRARNIHDNAARLGEQDRRVQRETGALKADGDSLEKLHARTEKALGGETAEGFEAEILRIEEELGLLDDVLDDVEGRQGGERDGRGAGGVAGDELGKAPADDTSQGHEEVGKDRK